MNYFIKAMLLGLVLPVLAGVGLVSQSPRHFISGGGGGGAWAIPNPESSAIPMEITAPRAGRGSSYAWYYAYPGIEYDRPIAVLGGSPPFQYRCTTCPSWLSVGENLPSDYIANGPGRYATMYGTPSAVGAPYTDNVTITVEDQLGTEVSVSFTITVTTANFLFVDDVNGSASSANGGSGTGTIGNPFLTMNDWYAGSIGGTSSATKNNTDHAGKIVYYRTGTYDLCAMYCNEDSFRVPMVNNNKPKVHIAYPGEAVNISFAGTTWHFYDNSPGEIYIAGFNMINTGQWAGSSACQHLNANGGRNDFMAYKLNWSTPTNAGVGSSNASFVFAVSDGFHGAYHSMIRNTFADTNSHDLWLMYGTDKIVIEWNKVTGAVSGDNSWGWYFKAEEYDASVRFNTAVNASNSQPIFRMDGYGTGGEEFDFIFNAYRTTGQAWICGFNPSSPCGNVYERRNTWWSGNATREAQNISGTLNTSNNVIRYTGATYAGSGGGSLTITGEATNLASTTGLVDSNLLLTGTDRTNSLNVKGHEIDIW